MDEQAMVVPAKRHRRPPDAEQLVAWFEACGLSRIRKSGFLDSDGVTARNNYNTTGSAGLHRDTIEAKINYVPTEQMTFFGRYSISQTNLTDPPVLGEAMGGATGGGQMGTAPSRIQSVAPGGACTISPTVTMHTNAGFTRQRLGATYAPDPDLGNFGVNTLRIPGTNGDTYRSLASRQDLNVIQGRLLPALADAFEANDVCRPQRNPGDQSACRGMGVDPAGRQGIVGQPLFDELAVDEQPEA